MQWRHKSIVFHRLVNPSPSLLQRDSVSLRCFFYTPVTNLLPVNQINWEMFHIFTTFPVLLLLPSLLPSNSKWGSNFQTLWHFEVSTLDILSLCYFQWNIGFNVLQIITFCSLHFTQHRNCFGNRVVHKLLQVKSISLQPKRRWGGKAGSQTPWRVKWCIRGIWEPDKQTNQPTIASIPRLRLFLYTPHDVKHDGQIMAGLSPWP